MQGCDPVRPFRSAGSSAALDNFSIKQMQAAPPAHSLLLFRRHVTLVRPGRLAWEDRTWMLPSDTPRANKLDCSHELGFSVRLPADRQPSERWRPGQGAQLD